MFFKFMGAALRAAPGAWWSAVTGSVSSVAATTVQGTVFGGKDSAFAVVDQHRGGQLARRGSQRRHAEHRVGRSAATGTSCAAGPQRIVDGFRQRGADPGRRGPSRRGAGAGPGGFRGRGGSPSPPTWFPAAEPFSAIPTSLSAVIGISSVEPVDVLGAANLRERLQRAYSDPAAGVEARTAGTELEGWQRVASKSYAWQVGSILADFLHRARGEVAQLVGQIQQATNRVSADERLQARQRAVSVILKTFFWALLLVLLVLAGIAALGWVRWPFALGRVG